MRDPLLFLYTGIFDQRDHSISAAKSEQACLCKAQKRSRRRFNSLPPDIHTDRLKNPDNIQHAKSSRTTLRRR